MNTKIGLPKEQLGHSAKARRSPSLALKKALIAPETVARSAVCMIVKDEVMEVATWVTHHLNVGFARVVVYDNHSEDGTSEILSLLARELPVEVVTWAPTTSRNPRATQGAAYDHCVQSIAADCEWLAFLDADEYVIPANGETLAGFLTKNDSASAIAINWMTFGSSCIVNGVGESPLSVMLRRAEDQSPANAHTKCFVRPADYRAVINPHAFEMSGTIVNVDGAPITWQSEIGPGYVGLDGIRQGNLRVHHYFTRSLAHWQRRRRRQNWSGPRTETEFLEYDRNEIFDDTALPWGRLSDLTIGTLKCRENIYSIRQRYQRSDIAVQDQREAQKHWTRITQAQEAAEATVLARMASPLTLFIDEFQADAVRGWAGLLGSSDPVTFTMQLDGNDITETTTDIERPDVQNAGWLCPTSGFRVIWPKRFMDGQTHVLTAVDCAGFSVDLRHGGRTASSLPVTLQSDVAVRGHVDEWSRGHFRGWVVRQTAEAEWKGGVQIEVRSRGIRVATAIANRPRVDVARAQGCDVFCGFEVTVPHAFRRSEPQSFDLVAMPENVPLSGSPITAATVFGGGALVAYELSDTVEHLFKEISLLRGRLREYQREDRHELATYDRWYRLYRSRLHARVREWQSQGCGSLDDSSGPSISVVMPIYRPEIAHLEAALESIRRQTLQNWEVLMIDDGSAEPELSRNLTLVATADARFRLVASDKNGGISHATNLGVEAARGRWIAFMDHDDCLDDVALEVMLRAGRQSGGTLLYSDEDKIDESGAFVEPAFKPAFNPRLLLSYNYLNHLLVADREFVRRVGGFRTEFDGAQDHDFLLRATEMLSETAVVHVPEVLYHWRKAARSTASSEIAKPEAIQRGVRAVTESLTRTGHVEPRVSAVAGVTHYRINISIPELAPRVRIVIPFRDEAASTRRCLETILAQTDYPNFEIVLVDNWSCSAETAVFLRGITRDQRVRVMRVEEEFNYSRLNNLALQGSDAAFFVLMNNDLFVEDAAWLRALVSEVLLDPRVAIVGGKYLYPDRTIQHAGVVLGQGGVAGHFYTGRPAGYQGYLGRAQVAQNVSAVTAACLLVRADVFRLVGGLDEANLKVAFNDVDFCLRVREAGYLITWTPDFTAEHHESLSRGSDDRTQTLGRFYDEVQYMQNRWASELSADPCYSRFFSLEGEAFNDLIDPRRDSSLVSVRTLAPLHVAERLSVEPGRRLTLVSEKAPRAKRRPRIRA